jgi:hypothetical protein
VLPDRHHVQFLELGALDAPAIDEGPVARIQIDELDPAIGKAAQQSVVP